MRIKYDPNFVENAVLHPSFQINGYTSWFLQVSALASGLVAAIFTSTDLLSVYP